MCGRYSLEFDDGFYTRYKAVNKLPIRSHYNIKPSQRCPVVVSQSPKAIELMVWGLIPFWEEKKEKPHGLINIRDDTVMNKSWPRQYFQSQRCLVPATGFYEWKITNAGKVPYYFHLKAKKYFSFAGLYTLGKTYTIITTGPNEFMAPIHNRMPVILKEEDEDKWINPKITELEILKQFLKPYEGSNLEGYPVSRRVNDPINDDQALIRPQKEVIKS